MYRAYKFRMYPNAEQELLIRKTFGCCRFVYNHFLEERQTSYKETGKSPTAFQQMKSLTALKQEYEWLQEVDSAALQAALRTLDTAFQNFFRGQKKGAPVGYPRFQSKNSSYKSYKTVRSIRVFEGAVQLPKLGKVKCKVHREVVGRILSATVSFTPSEKYFVSILCETEPLDKLPSTGAAVDITLGLDPLVTVSDGVEYPNHKYLEQSEKKLAKLQRQLARKVRGSSNWKKAKRKLACAHERVTNQRKDTLHKLTKDLVRKYDSISMEEVSVRKVLAENTKCSKEERRKLNKAQSDASLAELQRQLKYKAEWYGRDLNITAPEEA